jgi:hypothetical protein
VSDLSELLRAEVPAKLNSVHCAGRSAVAARNRHGCAEPANIGYRPDVLCAHSISVVHPERDVNKQVCPAGV